MAGKQLIMKQNKSKFYKGVVIYARHSSAGQRDESIEGPFRDCRDFCARNGFQVIAEYTDCVFTGTSDRRPDFQRMIKECERRL